ncbi:MAG: Holliday junction resolvase RuvX [Verrucomicrobiia bacterium]
MRILGVDFGSRRIGLAISDETGAIALAIGYIDGGNTDAVSREVARVAAERHAETIVVGLPVRLDGTSSRQTERTLKFIAALEEAATIPIKRWDERLTTAQAERVLLEGNVRRQHRREKRDQVAAQILLQCYLDAQNPPTVEE